jgi:hypothetical protein
MYGNLWQLPYLGIIATLLPYIFGFIQAQCMATYGNIMVTFKVAIPIFNRIINNLY